MFRARLVFLNFMTAIILLSCGRTYKPLPIENDSSSLFSNNSILLPSNSEGTTEVVDSFDHNKSTVTIYANKKYNPVEFNDGWYFVSNKSYFMLAEQMQVLSGRSGNHLAILSMTRNHSIDGLPSNINCAYVGLGSNTFDEYLSEPMGYKFSFCVDGNTVINEANYSDLKNSAENLINEESRVTKVLEFEAGDKIAIHIKNGNHAQDENSMYISTEVNYIFTKWKVVP